MLNSKLELFCREYAALGFGDGVEAYKLVYNPPATRNIKKAVASVLSAPGVIQRVAELRAQVEKEVIFDAEAVLREWISIATADASEIVKIRNNSCRYCWGKNGNYQWKNEREFANATGDWLSRPAKTRHERDRPNDDGGYGYSHTRPARPECPECGGEGDTDIVLTPTDQLSPQALRLYDGAKRTKNGLEVNLRSRDKALENIAKALGVLREPKTDGPAPGATSQQALPPVVPNDPVEASRTYADWLKNS